MALSEQVKARFRAHGIQLPTAPARPPANWFPGMRTEPRIPPNLLFRPMSTLSQHVQTATSMSALFERFIDDLCRGLCVSWNGWRAGARVDRVIINSVVGILPPGGLSGPGLMNSSAIQSRMRLGGASAWYRRYAWAIATAVEAAFGAWVRGYTHPTIPFPGGASAILPGIPMPPAPNTPIPLAVGRSPGDGLMQENALAGAMSARFGSGLHSGALFRSVAHAVAAEFTSWKGTTQIVLCLGAGGVGSLGGVVGAIGSGGRLMGPPVMTRDGVYTLPDGDGVFEGTRRALFEGIRSTLSALPEHRSTFEEATAPATLQRPTALLRQLDEPDRDEVLDELDEAVPGAGDAFDRWLQAPLPPPEADSL